MNKNQMTAAINAVLTAAITGKPLSVVARHSRTAIVFNSQPEAIRALVEHAERVAQAYRLNEECPDT